MTPPVSLQAIIRELEQHPDAQRIKKLLIYTAVNRWESNPQLLQRLSLERIVKKNLDQFLSFKELQRAFSTSVSTLSRPATYGRLANDILTQLSPLYENEDQDPSTGIVAAGQNSHQSITEIHLEVAVQTLEEHRENIRIKKLLYALCFKRWENSFQVLEEYSLANLLRQVVVNYPTRNQFETILRKLVSLLNRQQIYGQLADVILGAIAPLYKSGDSATGLTQPTADPPAPVPTPVVPPPPPPPAPSPAPESVNYKQTMAFNIDELPIPKPAKSMDLDFSENQTLALDPETQMTQTMLLNTGPPRPMPAPAPAPVPKKKHFAAALNIYELKLEVMKYANPLRTKILLFSVVHHPFDLSGKDWSMLRTCDFDELLSEVLRDASSLKALEIKLSAIARSLFDANEHLQAAGAIVQAVTTFTNPPVHDL
ncbi:MULTISPECIES: hypothetical protein [Cyanophyceae]|uniref:hypothetical protein n=1 Tax=Cyanophyceae TaxID=3028117 RepID=UPI00016DC44F|nr:MULTISPECIES: hypothetical protein [Cyanophyceae]ACA99219.1 hypothetical protein SYNPCC7002_A1221 [Picosynechococcus sp. PCC 7002]SMH33712.1 hypothetical protein SAMN06272755_0486 [Picosynechococcus sp. OG1]SMQ84448.1 hypothetical protein SAMN06272774_2862 [Synechococcus sp. 7002]